MIDLDELERLREAATLQRYMPFSPRMGGLSPAVVTKRDSHQFATTSTMNDARYIAALVNAAPELIALARKYKHGRLKKTENGWMCLICYQSGMGPSEAGDHLLANHGS